MKLCTLIQPSKLPDDLRNFFEELADDIDFERAVHADGSLRFVDALQFILEENGIYGYEMKIGEAVIALMEAKT